MFGSFLAALVISFVATLGFGVLLHAPNRALLPASATGMAAHGCYCLLGTFGFPEQAAIFAAAAGAAILAELLARRMKMAATVFVTLSIIPLVPGLNLYRAMAFLAQGQSEAGLELGVSAMLTILMISLGIGMGSFLVRLRRGSIAPPPPVADEGGAKETGEKECERR